MNDSQKQRIANRLFQSTVITALKKIAGRASEEYRQDIINDVFLAIVCGNKPFEFFESLDDTNFKNYIIRIGINLATYEHNKTKRNITGELFDVAIQIRENLPDDNSIEYEREFLIKWERYERLKALYPNLATWEANELEGRKEAAKRIGKSEGEARWKVDKMRELLKQSKAQLILFVDND